jgi:hypothetical protein
LIDQLDLGRPRQSVVLNQNDKSSRGVADLPTLEPGQPAWVQAAKPANVSPADLQSMQPGELA